MREKIRLWFECDFKLFSWSILQVILGKFTTRELAEMYSRQIKLVNWQDKMAMRNALAKEDMKEAQRIAEKAETEDYIDENLYNHFMFKLIGYELFYIFIIILLLIIVFNIEGR